ncbi:Gfo/Idh/MocA family oxidoreductase [Fodinicola acaciae]|uniref:Gfo/Idh/MocA family oxidoreductase n=1 Tax=Fodinicola acaciae TaxID=2681555 RepID=UPI0013D215BB|nr:Gfo/Idh/MocA family oxidoreductase [Fodinicola acaciae]
MRIGLAGIENSHAEQVIRYLNLDRRQPGVRLTSFLSLDPKRDTELLELDPALTPAPNLDTLASTVDGAVVCDRDGARHLASAAPFLRAGKPAFVDKPLATSVRDAAAMIAQATGGILVSHSPLRFTVGWQKIARRCAERGAPRHLRLDGPADPASPWSGLFFYGIHLVDPALSVLDGEPGPLTVRVHDDRIDAITTVGPTAVHLVFTGPGTEFHAEARWSSESVATQLELAADYVAPGLDDFFDTVAGRKPAPTAGQLTRPIALLERVCAAIKDGTA